MLDRVVLGLCNRALNSGDTPALWSEINIVPVPESGPLNKVADYRGISMCPMVTKVINKMILMRIRPTIETILRKNQNGFRPGRGTVPHILALRRILEGIRDKKLPATIIFIDFKKAFDSVDRDNMFEILKSYGVPPNLLQLIISIYEKIMARVTSPDEQMETLYCSSCWQGLCKETPWHPICSLLYWIMLLGQLWMVKKTWVSR